MSTMFSMNKLALAAALTGLLFATSGCLAIAAGAAVGGGYELHQAKAMDDLDDEFEAGEINREEYLSRKHEIEESALFQ